MKNRRRYFWQLNFFSPEKKSFSPPPPHFITKRKVDYFPTDPKIRRRGEKKIDQWAGPVRTKRDQLSVERARAFDQQQLRAAAAAAAAVALVVGESARANHRICTTVIEIDFFKTQLALISNSPRFFLSLPPAHVFGRLRVRRRARVRAFVRSLDASFSA